MNGMNLQTMAAACGGTYVGSEALAVREPNEIVIDSYVLFHIVPLNAVSYAEALALKHDRAAFFHLAAQRAALKPAGPPPQTTTSYFSSTAHSI